MPKRDDETQNAFLIRSIQTEAWNDAINAVKKLLIEEGVISRNGIVYNKITAMLRKV